MAGFFSGADGIQFGRREVKRVRKHLIVWAGATLALGFAACGGASTAATTSGSSGSATACVDAKAVHRAYVVVEHQSGTTIQRCVGFDGAAIDGMTLMKRSGIEFQSQTTSFGPAACQIDNEPKQFTECFPKDQPFWALWVESGGAWTMSQVGYGQVSIHDRDALGWHYVPQSGPPAYPPPLPAGG